MPIDFLIVGGGIGGAVLANRLARAGRKVLIVERLPAPTPIVRPEILWPATVEVLRGLLPASVEERRHLPVRSVTALVGDRPLLGVGEDVFARVGVRPGSTDPTQTREQLLAAGDFELRRGVEVVDVLVEDRRVVGVRARDPAGATVEITARWTVGDDGAASPVRRACGIAMDTQWFPLEFLTFGFAWPPSYPPAAARLYINPHRGESRVFGMAAIPLPGDRGAGLIPVRSAALDDAEAFSRDLEQFRGSIGAGAEALGSRGKPADFARVRRPWGHAARYGTAGAVLLGDAAHPVSPAGGQGANMSVADAAALADALLDDELDALAAYERRRRPANERSLEITRAAARGLEMPAVLRAVAGRLLPFVLERVSARPILAGRLLAILAGTFRDRGK